MRVRGVAFSLSVVMAAAALGNAAEAGEQRKQRFIEPPPENYYAGPDFIHRVPGLRVLFGDYALSPEEYDRLYGDDDQFDESYYEPQPLVTKKPKAKPAAKAATPSKTAKPVTASTAAAVDKSAPVKPASKKPLAKATPAPAAKPAGEPVAETEEAPVQAAPPVKSSAGMSCDKASAIIAGYGFSAVKPDSCNGKIYAFNATRDGRTFAIKLDASNGELTEVKKLN